jgi:DNA-binding transcriptional ArsR family regulator
MDGIPPPSAKQQHFVAHPKPGEQDGDFHLDGRGLLLVPSFFLRSPIFTYDPTAPESCTLVFPAQLDINHAADVWANAKPGRALAGLLGRTRALVLTAIADGVATTGALANHTGTSSAAASQHTAILREAGLIVTRRHRNTVQHSLTQTGLSLLNRNSTTSPSTMM